MDYYTIYFSKGEHQNVPCRTVECDEGDLEAVSLQVAKVFNIYHEEAINKDSVKDLAVEIGVLKVWAVKD